MWRGGIIRWKIRGPHLAVRPACFTADSGQDQDSCSAALPAMIG